MSEPETRALTTDELDQLADYLADALPAAEAAVVADKIRSDPRWAAASEDLARSDAHVRSLLAALATRPEPMPCVVAARLDAAIADAGARRAHDVNLVAAARTDTADRSGVTRTPSTLRQSTRRADQHPDRPATRPANRSSAVTPGARRGWRVAVGIAAAAVVLAGGAAVLSELPQGLSRTTSAPALDSGAEGTADTPTRPESQPVGETPLVLATGTDYTADTLALLGRQPMLAGPSLASGASGAAPPDGVVKSPGPYASVGTTAQLSACLKLVVTAYPGTVVLVDYASFEGSPALVILVHQTAGSVAVVVGPSCGAGDAAVRAAVGTR